MDDILRTTATAQYKWFCEVCETENLEDSDPAGDTLECNDCGTEYYITETK